MFLIPVFKKLKGLVIRGVRYKESDRIITILSSEGTIAAKAVGALKSTAKISAGTRDLMYSEFTLYGNLGKWNVKEAVIIDEFKGLNDDLSALSLAYYFAELLDTYASGSSEDGELLQLGLNSLYALSRDLYSLKHIKSAFELRLMCIAGYTPEPNFCAGCKSVWNSGFVFSVREGVSYCKKCCSEMNKSGVLLTEEVRNNMVHIIGAPAKKFLQFSDADCTLLSEICERYLLMQSDRLFRTLDYYKQYNSTGNILEKKS